MFRLDGKTIAVIGAGSGIGQAVALGVAQQGGHTICLDINADHAAATEWGEQGVRVNAVGPGVTETPLTAPIKAQAAWYQAYADKTPMKRWATAEEMAGPTVFLLSDAASYVTGTILFVDGGWLANDGRFTPPGM